MALVELSKRDMTASHVLLVPIVTIALIIEARRSIFSSVVWNWTAAPAVVLLGAGCAWIAHAQAAAGEPRSLTLRVGAIVLLWLSGFLVFYGRRALEAALFPLMFLLFTIPIPDMVLAIVTSALKRGSAEIVEAIFSLTGTPHLREGFVFSLPNVTIEIADECSGIRSTIALLMTSLLAGQFLLRRPWQRALLVAAIVPITILKNAIRIATLSLLAIHYDPGFLAGRLHHEGGIVFFLIGLAILTPIIGLLHRVEAVHARARR